MNDSLVLYLLSIQGTIAAKTWEEARQLHNETAGAPANVAAARSLGDLSHLVHVPFGQDDAANRDFFVLDLWNNLEGLNQFFANPQVQEQAGRIFAHRDPVVWSPAEGFTSYHMPAVQGRDDRVVAVIRGILPSVEQGMHVHNTIVNQAINKARQHGNISHEAYLRLTPPDAPASLEFFAVDVWMDAAGMGEHYQDPELMAGFAEMFAEPPTATMWSRPQGVWTEW